MNLIARYMKLSQRLELRTLSKEYGTFNCVVYSGNPAEDTEVAISKRLRWILCGYGYEDIIIELLEYIPDEYAYMDMFKGACEFKRFKLLDYLVSDGLHDRQIMRPTYKSMNNDIIDILIYHGFDDWNYILRWACLNLNVEVTRNMIDRGGDIMNAIECACEFDSTILINEVMPEIRMYGLYDTILYRATEFGSIYIVRLIIKYSSSANIGIKPACRIGCYDVIEVLMQCGADEWEPGLPMLCNMANTYPNNAERLKCISYIVENTEVDLSYSICVAFCNMEYEVACLLLSYGRYNLIKLISSLEDLGLHKSIECVGKHTFIAEEMDISPINWVRIHHEMTEAPSTR